jgi:hypothetical protein
MGTTDERRTPTRMSEKERRRKRLITHNPFFFFASKDEKQRRRREVDLGLLGPSSSLCTIRMNTRIRAYVYMDEPARSYPQAKVRGPGRSSGPLAVKASEQLYAYSHTRLGTDHSLNRPLGYYRAINAQSEREREREGESE